MMDFFFGTTSGLLLIVAVYLFMFYSATTILMERHAHEISLIWYINSFFFLLFYGLEVIALKKNTPLAKLCGSSEVTCVALYDYLTNMGDEFRLVIVVVVLAIAPQLLSYGLSGISGTASSPKFVSQIGKFALWSLAKFMVTLGGISIAHPFAQLTLGQAPNAKDFVLGFAMTGIGFVYAGFEVLINEKLPKLLKAYLAKNTSVSALLMKAHKIATRNLPRGEIAPELQ
ncbi:hypothetical protein [Bradyrhizobium arachidis]|uniref:Uncharacterized protein n=1 Tax=Bradyrhizobium arachidis TaxID=858423 RepID=A0AAE7TH96_9BRAD|nr:hypothetical protein [Bradyrhizobium arachidis]QOZ69097.1 hypothetical protein WN72_24325 [Bradyrhizobium arachidis]SFV00619.1 hypothetical protein SAMN05192541_109239 [Bradyrhizobium arachidis]